MAELVIAEGNEGIGIEGSSDKKTQKILGEAYLGAKRFSPGWLARHAKGLCCNMRLKKNLERLKCMGVLWHRLMRSVARTAGQFIAMATIVALGVGCFYGMNLALDNLIRAKSDFYRETKAADHYFHVQRASVAVIREIEALPGVEQVTGRIQEDAKIIVDGVPRGIGRIISFEVGDRPVNGFLVVAGPAPDDAHLRAEAGIKAYVDSQYYAANNLYAGAKLDVIARRRQATIEVAGAASSPDYLFKMRSNRDFPDRRNYAVIHVPRRYAEKFLDMEREVNQILVRYSPGANELRVRDSIKNILMPYGLVADYPQQEQSSAKHVASQVDGLKSSTSILPVGFFITAFGIIYIILHRFITMQHFHIGVMKAIGCDSRTVIAYYTAYALAVTVTGAILGILAGSVLGPVAFETFAGLLSLPGRYEASGQAMITASVIACIMAGLVVGMLSSRRIAKIRPAMALRSATALNRKTPDVASNGWQQKLLSSWKMALRSVARNKVRFLVTTTGLTVTVGILIIALCYLDSRHYLIARFFSIENRYDYYVGLNNTFKIGDVQYLQAWEGVRDIEPVLEMSVSFSPHIIGGREREPKDGVILGLRPDSRMIRAFDEEERPVGIPEEGVLLNVKIAEKLGLKIGDRVEVKTNPLRGNSYQESFLITGIVKQNMGSVSFMPQAAAQKLVNEKDAVNAVLLQTDRKVIKSLEDRLMEIPEVAQVQSKAGWAEIFAQLVGSMTYFTYIMIATAGLLGATTVYLTSMINFNERQRELACLRIIGWSMDKIALLLFNEIIVTIVLAIILGFPFGKYAGAAFLKAASNDTFTWPNIVYPSTYLLAGGLTVLFAATGHLAAVIRIRNLNMVEVLKTRD
jgi:putative ABC transport system permease protein